MNSRTSRPRSPTSAITFTSAVVERAIMPSKRRLADARPGEDAETLAATARHERVERAHAEPDALPDPGPGERVRRRRRSSSATRFASSSPRPSSGIAEPVDHAAEQRLADGDAERRARSRCTVVPGPIPCELAERHQQRAAAAEADDLGGDLRPVATLADQAHLADLDLQPGGLDDQADQVADATARRARSAARDRDARASSAPVLDALGVIAVSSKRPHRRGARPRRSRGRSGELRCRGRVDLARLGPHDRAAAADPAVGLDVEVLDPAELGLQPVDALARPARGRRGSRARVTRWRSARRRSAPRPTSITRSGCDLESRRRGSARRGAVASSTASCSSSASNARPQLLDRPRRACAQRGKRGRGLGARGGAVPAARPSASPAARAWARICSASARDRGQHVGDRRLEVAGRAGLSSWRKA